MRYPLLVVCLLIAFSAALPGIFFGPGDWYRQLIQPAWTPPAWVFGPVWSILYCMMGVSLWLFITNKSDSRLRYLGMIAFSAQLLFNAAWSVLFFGLHLPTIALIDITLLWISLSLTIKYFFTIEPLAAKLLVPYLVWVSYAWSLNLGIVILNP